MVQGDAANTGAQSGDPARAPALWAIFILLAAMPPIMALATWDTQGHFGSNMGVLRFLAPPILAAELAMILLAGWAWLRMQRPPLAISRTIAAMSITLTLIIVCMPLFAPNPILATIRAAMTMIHFCFGLSVITMLRLAGFGQWRRLWWTLASGIAFYLLLIPIFVLSIDDPTRFGWQSFGLGVANIRHAGFYAITGAGLALGLAATEPRRLRYWLATAIAAGAFAFAFWSGSRGPLIALVLAFPVSTWLAPRLRTLPLIIAAAASLGAGFLIAQIHTPPSSVFGAGRMMASVTAEHGDSISSGVMSGRAGLWHAALEAWVSRPWFGYGEGQVQDILATGTALQLHHPHNMILQLLLQWGLIGTLLMLALMALAWWRILGKVRASGGALAPAFVALNMLLAAALYDGVFFFTYPMMMLALLAGACLAWRGPQA